jgi:NAD(P)-dependent dehydrogenase (short-subunit alcohol dehydrogenase family)
VDVDRSFEGRVVLVAGGTGALGAVIAREFAGAGARVAVTHRHPEELAALLASAGANAGAIEGHAVDAADEPAVKSMVEAILARHGRVDALVNAIGGYAGGMPLWRNTPDVLARMIARNVTPGATLARAVVPAMLAARRGAIVNVAARAGVAPEAGAAEYAASKAAAIAMMAALAADLAGSGVRVNSILPSIIDTPANRRAMPQAGPARWPRPEAIARVVLFLASDDADLVHGASIPVYGHG